MCGRLIGGCLSGFMDGSGLGLNCVRACGLVGSESSLVYRPTTEIPREVSAYTLQYNSAALRGFEQDSGRTHLCRDHVDLRGNSHTTDRHSRWRDMRSSQDSGFGL